MSKGSIKHQVILWSQSKDISQTMKLKKDDLIVKLTCASSLPEYKLKVKQHQDNVLRNPKSQPKQALVIITPKTAKQALQERRTQYLFYKYFLLGKIDSYDGGKPQSIEQLKKQLLFARRNESELAAALLQVSVSLSANGKQSSYYRCNFDEFDQNSKIQPTKKIIGYTEEEISQSVQYLSEKFPVNQSVANIWIKNYPNQSISLVNNMSRTNMTSLHDTSINTHSNILSASILADVKDKQEKQSENISTNNILAAIEKQEAQEVKSPTLKKFESKFQSTFSTIPQQKKEEQIEIPIHQQNQACDSCMKAIDKSYLIEEGSKIYFQKKNKLNISIEVNQIISNHAHEANISQVLLKKQESESIFLSKKTSMHTQSTKDDKCFQAPQKQMIKNEKKTSADKIVVPSCPQFIVNETIQSKMLLPQIEQSVEQKKQIDAKVNDEAIKWKEIYSQQVLVKSNSETYSRSRSRQSSKKFNYKNLIHKSSKVKYEHKENYTNMRQLVEIQEELAFIEERVKVENQPLEQNKVEVETYDRIQIMWVDPNGNRMLVNAIEQQLQKQKLDIKIRQIQKFDYDQIENVLANEGTQYLAITSNTTFDQLMSSTSYPFPNISTYFVYCMRLEKAYSNMKKYSPSNPVFITNESNQIVEEVCTWAREQYSKIHGTEVF